MSTDSGLFKVVMAGGAIRPKISSVVVTSIKNSPADVISISHAGLQAHQLKGT